MSSSHREKTLLSLMAISIAVVLGAGTLVACVGKQIPSVSSRDTEKVAEIMAAGRVVFDPARYGQLVRVEGLEGATFGDIWFELAVKDDDSWESLKEIAQAHLYLDEIGDMEVPPLSGSDIRRDLDNMEIDSVYWKMFDGLAEEDGARAQTMEIMMVFATAPDGGKFLFYIG